MELVAALSRMQVSTAILGGLLLVFSRNVLRGPRTANDEGPNDEVGDVERLPTIHFFLVLCYVFI